MNEASLIERGELKAAEGCQTSMCRRISRRFPFRRRHFNLFRCLLGLPLSSSASAAASDCSSSPSPSQSAAASWSLWPALLHCSFRLRRGQHSQNSNISQQRQQAAGRGQRLEQPFVQAELQARALIEQNAREARDGLAHQRQMDGSGPLADEIEFLRPRCVLEEAQRWQRAKC